MERKKEREREKSIVAKHVHTHVQPSAELQTTHIVHSKFLSSNQSCTALASSRHIPPPDLLP